MDTTIQTAFLSPELEPVRQRAMAEAQEEMQRTATAWADLEETFQIFQERAVKVYGQSFSIDSYINDKALICSQGEFSYGKGAGIWLVSFDGHPFAFPLFKGKKGNRAGKFLVMADGTVHFIEESRWTDNSLHFDAKLYTKSETTLNNSSLPLFDGAEIFGDYIYLRNYDPQLKALGINSLGAIAVINQHQIRIEFVYLTNVSFGEIEKYYNLLQSTLKSVKQS